MEIINTFIDLAIIMTLNLFLNKLVKVSKSLYESSYNPLTSELPIRFLNNFSDIIRILI